MPGSPVVTPPAVTGLFTWACLILNCFFVCVCCWELEGIWGWAQKCLNLAKCDAKWLWARGLGEVVFSLLLSLELPVLHSSLWSC